MSPLIDGENPSSSVPSIPPPLTDDAHYPLMGTSKIPVRPRKRKKPWKAALISRLKKSAWAPPVIPPPEDDTADREAIEELRLRFASPLEESDYESYVSETLDQNLNNEGHGLNDNGGATPLSVSKPADQSNDNGGPATPPVNRDPWLKNAGNFICPPPITKADLALSKHEVRLSNDCLEFELDDITPVHIGWGYSLLGFFAGRFPGKGPIQNMVNGWICTPRVSYHRNGWIVFRFDTEENMESVRHKGPYSLFGNPLILYHLPADFRFDAAPETKFPVWASLPNLPLELWNRKAIGKIASLVGSPIEVDYKSVVKDCIDGPRFRVLVDALTEPREGIFIKMPTGTQFIQPIEFEFYPKLCLKCSRLGHFASACAAKSNANVNTKGPHHPPVGGFFRNRFDRNNRSRPPLRDWQQRNRSISRPPHAHGPGQQPRRNISRPPHAGGQARQRHLSRGQPARTRWVSKTRGADDEEQLKAASILQNNEGPKEPLAETNPKTSEAPAAMAIPEGQKEHVAETASENIHSSKNAQPNSHIYFHTPQSSEPLVGQNNTDAQARIQPDSNCPPPTCGKTTNLAKDVSATVLQISELFELAGDSSCTLGSTDTFSENSTSFPSGTPPPLPDIPSTSAAATLDAAKKVAEVQQDKHKSKPKESAPPLSNNVGKDAKQQQPKAAVEKKTNTKGNKSKSPPKKKKNGKGGNFSHRFK